MEMDGVMRIPMEQEDIDEIALMTDPQEIKDYLTMLILACLSSPLEAMSHTSSRPETLH